MKKIRFNFHLTLDFKLIPFLFIVLLFLNGCFLNRDDKKKFFDPYVILWDGEITINQDHIIEEILWFKISSGSEVYITSKEKIVIFIYAGVKIEGSKTNPIIFRNKYPVMHDIYIVNSEDDNIISYCDFGNNRLIVDFKGVIENSKIKYLQVLHSSCPLIKNNNIGLLECYDYSYPIIKFNIFDRNFFEFPAIGSDEIKNIRIDGLFATPTIVSNNIYGNRGVSQPANNYIVYNYSEKGINLRNNYWGTENINYITNTLIFDYTKKIVLKPIASSPFKNTGSTW